MAGIVQAPIWQKFVNQGFVKCADCEEEIDLSNADDINDAVKIWNTHVNEVHGENKPDWANEDYARFPTKDN